MIASPINPKLIEEYVELLRGLSSLGHNVITVVGGGKLARDLIELAKELKLNEREQDEIAILASRLIAQLFVKKLGKDGCGFTPTSIEEAINCLKTGKVIVMGGLRPGMTTDAVAAMVAEELKADLFVKATDQEGVYTKDPREHVDAKKLDRATFEEVLELLERGHKPGVRRILDPEAVERLQGAKVKAVVVDGRKPENLLLAVKGESVGTIIE